MYYIGSFFIYKKVLTSTMTERLTQITITTEIRTKLKAMNGNDSYSIYIDRLIRSGNKQDG